VKMGVEILTEKDHFVHVSGHPARDEVARMYGLIKPRIAVPVHGEAMHLHEHCKFAREIGISMAMEVENGDVLCLDRDTPAKISRVDSGYLMVDGNYIIDENSLILKERRELQLNGIIMIFVVLNKNGVIIRGPRVNSSGLLNYKEDKSLFDKISEKVRKLCEVHGKKEEKALSRLISRDIAKIIRGERGKSPYVMVQVEKLYF
jgi:ribonuclease J